MGSEMEKMMGCQIPALGVWNYCNDLSITQYFDSAMQARLMKRWNRRGGDRSARDISEKQGVSFREQLVLFRTPSFQRKPAQIKVIRREVKKHSSDGDRREDGVAQAQVGAYPIKNRAVSKPVDEDLYKIPQALLYQKPRKMRKVVWSMWIGCLGLDCIA
ncbi:hypothetical protein BS78_06G036900 [Paspalum vaginatum]|nr:hypothetical protein BS78_06G036900 [Paspalum vaginatum]